MPTKPPMPGSERWRQLPASDDDRVHRETCALVHCARCTWAEHKVRWQELFLIDPSDWGHGTWVRAGTDVNTGLPALGCRVCAYAAAKGDWKLLGAQKWACTEMTGVIHAGRFRGHEQTQSHLFATGVFLSDFSPRTPSVPTVPPSLSSPSPRRRRPRRSPRHAGRFAKLPLRDCVRLYKMLQKELRRKVHTKKKWQGGYDCSKASTPLQQVSEPLDVDDLTVDFWQRSSGTSFLGRP